MATFIEDPQTGELISRLSHLTGETAEEAVQAAVRERLNRFALEDGTAYVARLRAITSRVASMPILDNRTAEEIIGYNEHGHFD